MAKTLKDFLEGYLKVKSADEQKFIDKHVTAKNPDRNGNGDDVFKGSTKTIDRRKDRKGYNPGEDEKVYEGLSESTYEFDVSGENGKAGVDKFVKHANSKGIKAKVHTYDGPAGGNPVVHLTHKDPKVLHSYVNTHMYPVHDISKHKINEALKGNQHKIDANKNGKVDAHDFKLLRGKKKVAEEAEELEELSHDTLRSYRMKAKSVADHGGDQRTKGRELAGRKSYGGRMAGIEKAKVMAKEEAEQIDESAKIAAHLIKRYGDNVRKSHVMSAAKDFGVDPSKLAKMVRTKLGKTTLGEEQIDEVSAATKDSYTQKAGKQLSDLFKKSGKSADDARKYYNRKNTVRKIANEEVEEIDEKLSAKTPMGTYIKDFTKSDAPQFKGKSASKRRVMAIAAKLSAERGGKPLNKEERLQNRINDLTEVHQRTMMHVFEKLNEDNKSKFLEACDTPEGVDQMLDFAINNRGE